MPALFGQCILSRRLGFLFSGTPQRDYNSGTSGLLIHPSCLQAPRGNAFERSIVSLPSVPQGLSGGNGVSHARFSLDPCPSSAHIPREGSLTKWIHSLPAPKRLHARCYFQFANVRRQDMGCMRGTAAGCRTNLHVSTSNLAGSNDAPKCNDPPSHSIVSYAL